MMKSIGLTGSIGMGKTETAKIFAKLAVPVFDSDAAVHKLLGPDGAAVEQIARVFDGVKIGNQIDRKLLGQKVFSNDDALNKLEAILHPLVAIEREEFANSQNSDLILFDIPLLFEKGYENDVDFIVVVTAPYNVQRKRVLERPQMTEQRFLEILAKQLADEDKRARADFIVQTDQGIEYAEDQAKNILKTIRKQINA